MTEIPAPLALHREPVRPEWIDYNGHMNVAYYVMVADHATDAFFDYLGIGRAYVERENKSVFAIDMRAAYLRELTVDTEISVKTQLLDYDEKRFQTCYLLEHGTEGWTSAVCTWVSVHVDLATRRSAPFPAAVQERFGAVMEAHQSLPRHRSLDRTFGLSR